MDKAKPYNDEGAGAGTDEAKRVPAGFELSEELAVAVVLFLLLEVAPELEFMTPIPDAIHESITLRK